MHIKSMAQPPLVKPTFNHIVSVSSTDSSRPQNMKHRPLGHTIYVAYSHPTCAQGPRNSFFGKCVLLELFFLFFKILGDIQENVINKCFFNMIVSVHYSKQQKRRVYQGLWAWSCELQIPIMILFVRCRTKAHLPSFDALLIVSCQSRSRERDNEKHELISTILIWIQFSDFQKCSFFIFFSPVSGISVSNQKSWLS